MITIPTFRLDDVLDCRLLLPFTSFNTLYLVSHIRAQVVIILAKTQAKAEENTLVLTKHICISVFYTMGNKGVFLPYPWLVVSVTVGLLMTTAWQLEIWRSRAQVPFRALVLFS